MAEEPTPGDSEIYVEDRPRGAISPEQWGAALEEVHGVLQFKVWHHPHMQTLPVTAVSVHLPP